MLKNFINTLSYQLRYNYYKLFVKRPDAVITFGTSLGDDLLCTIVARQLKEKGYKNIWIKTFFPEMFLNNPDISRVIVKRGQYDHAGWEVERFISKCKVFAPHYTLYDEAMDMDEIPSQHIVNIMCEKAEVDVPKIVKPFIWLSEREKSKGKIYSKQICIQSGGSAARNHMINKEWFPERFLKLVEQLQDKYNIIQIGSKEDTLLPGVTDMRGKTTIRETAALLSNSVFFIGLVGFLMHLARAVDCRSIIIFGGREKPGQTGYDFNINLHSAIECSPCWLRNRCNYKRKCMEIISVSDVYEAALKMGA